MARSRRHAPLRVLLNNRLVGHFHKATSGAIAFQYDQSWLAWSHALPVSLSLPLREDTYRGEPVAAVFDNLLPDSDALRRLVAEKVGAAGIDAYSLLAAIGRDCVGALQFVGAHNDVEEIGDSATITGEPVNEGAIEKLLNGLAQAPLGLSGDDAFRLSLAGVQEKTALLRHKGKWLKPRGSTPTSHIFKKQIGRLPNGLDLSNSVENETGCCVWPTGQPGGNPYFRKNKIAGNRTLRPALDKRQASVAAAPGGLLPGALSAAHPEISKRGRTGNDTGS